MTDLNNAHDLEDLYGPLYPYSDNKRGDVITFTDSEHGTLSGTILWVVGPGPIAGTDMSMHYIVDARGEWPDTVFPSDIVADREA